MKKVGIIEDQTALRDLIGQIFDRDPNFETVVLSGDGRDGMEKCLELKPDLIILDVMLPGMNGVEVLRQLSRRLPKSRVLVFSAVYNHGIIRDLLQNGVHGIVEKTAPLEEFIKGIEAVMAGRTYFGPEISSILREAMTNPDNSRSPLEKLTARERQIVQLIAESYSTKDIAAKLDISVKTAENHRTNLMRKLDLHDVAGITRFAIANGLTPPDAVVSQI